MGGKEMKTGDEAWEGREGTRITVLTPRTSPPPDSAPKYTG